MPNVRGFTIVELFAVLAILGLLLALALPAVQQARESARRVDCEHRLREIGLALHTYESSHRVFPPGATLGGWSFRTMILPELGLGSVYSLIDFENNLQQPEGFYTCTREGLRLNTAAPNWDHLGRQLHCPSDPFTSPVLTNYIGVAGSWPTPFQGAFYPGDRLPPDVDGMLYFCSRVRTADVTDGASDTLFVGERGTGHSSGSANTLCGSSTGAWDAWLTSAGGLGPGHYQNLDDAFHFWSYHQGGAQFLFVDGHVQLLNYGIDRRVYFSLSTRAGGEAVGEF